MSSTRNLEIQKASCGCWYLWPDRGSPRVPCLQWDSSFQLFLSVTQDGQCTPGNEALSCSAQKIQEPAGAVRSVFGTSPRTRSSDFSRTQILGIVNAPHIAQPPVKVHQLDFGAVVGNLPMVALANNATGGENLQNGNWGPSTHIPCFRGFPLNCSPHSCTAS